MKSQKEIKKRLRDIKNNLAYMGTYGDLLDCLPFEEARKYYNDDYIYKVESGREGRAVITTDEQVIEEMKDYMQFAIGKAEDKRGLSAMRSIAHYSNWLWLIGNDELSNSITAYTDYGMPQLKEICAKYGFDNKTEQS